MSEGENYDAGSLPEVGVAYIEIERDGGEDTGNFRCFEEGCGHELFLPLDVNAEAGEQQAVTCPQCGAKYTNKPLRLAIVKLRGKTGADYTTWPKDYTAEVEYTKPPYPGSWAERYPGSLSIQVEATSVTRFSGDENGPYDEVVFKIPRRLVGGGITALVYHPGAVRLSYQNDPLESSLTIKSSEAVGRIVIEVKLGPTRPWSFSWARSEGVSKL